jgi:bifunctional DNA-binding transcriptional regulator/antitoxin component of YhaV-PrlF toxin-antitoxin module
MKATGIVRRIDDLGRIVIPKEIRRSFRIKEGKPFTALLELIEPFITNIEKLINRLGQWY